MTNAHASHKGDSTKRERGGKEAEADLIDQITAQGEEMIETGSGVSDGGTEKIDIGQKKSGRQSASDESSKSESGYSSVSPRYRQLPW